MPYLRHVTHIKIRFQGHYSQTKTTNINTTCALLQTTWDKGEPNICLFLMDGLDFRMHTMVISSLLPVVCWRAHALFTLFVCVCV
jgi:hypothetical protein